MNDIEKNILDLKHSVSLAKAGAFLALAFSSWIAVFFGMREFYSDVKIIITIPSLVFIFFFYYCIKFFENCKEIHEELEKLK